MSSHIQFVSIGTFIESIYGSEWWLGNKLAVTNEYVWSRLKVVVRQRIRRDQHGCDQQELRVVAWQRTSCDQRDRNQ